LKQEDWASGQVFGVLNGRDGTGVGLVDQSSLSSNKWSHYWNRVEPLFFRDRSQRFLRVLLLFFQSILNQIRL